MNRHFTALAIALALALCPAAADAFCGFYVGGAGAKMFNNATQVVLMRDGTRTVLSMQNNYQGPAQDFALVVPVPQVLKKENVKTLNPSVFDRVDSLGAPRLVEYFEQDPCYRPRPMPDMSRSSAVGGVAKYASRGASRKRETVKIEAQFSVGEYDIVVLSATDSADLYVWLKENGYNIPNGAEKVLRPYVASEMKFFVAKVDIEKVRVDPGGKTMLSPLRFFYDTDTFSLPIRLGLLNAKGAQDLIVNILAKNQRYEVANYKNVTIPTNIRVRKRTKADFGSFYASLFDDVLRRNKGAVVTEYAWQASKCDPCPGGGFRGLTGGDLASLGGDVLGAGIQQIASSRGRGRRPPSLGGGSGFVLTRLHARYTAETLGEDLVFRAAEAIVGGRGSYTGQRLAHGAQPSTSNNFQGRYYILQRWTGPVTCDKPRYGVWGGPPSQGRGYGSGLTGPSPGAGGVTAAKNLAFVKNRKANLAAYLAQSVPELRFWYRR